MSKVIITGGIGFIGQATINSLLEKNYDVKVLDMEIPKKEIEGVEYVKIDLSDNLATKRAMVNADFCLHLASKIGGLQYLQRYPATILSENNKINSSVFEAASNANVQRIVFVSSGMVFENAKNFPAKEDDLETIPPPKGFYGYSKFVGEKYCKAFKKEYGLNYSIARLFNVYGENEKLKKKTGMGHVIPELISKAISLQTPFEVFGSGQQIRSYTYIQDVTEGIIKLMEHPKAENDDFNISSSEEIKIINLAKKIWDYCNLDKEFKVKHLESFKNDMSRRVADVSKATNVLGWNAKVTLDEGLSKTIDWFKQKT